MGKIIIVAAIGKNNELGLDNHLIWRIKEDLAFYKKITEHENIILGRKTFESMPSSALKGRNIFVLSNSSLDQHYDINCFNNIESLIEYINISNQTFIVVGGSQIYEALMPYTDIMYLTEIEAYAAADTFFPEIDIEKWDIEPVYYHASNYVDNDVSYIRNRYVRKRER